MKKIDYTVPYAEWEVICAHCGHKGQVKSFPEKKCTMCGNYKFMFGNGKVQGIR
jgi:hypothetical protein